MIVWGGLASCCEPALRSGGVYFAVADGDGDGVVNGCDCAPDDPLAFAVPSEIGNVRWLSDGLTVVWASDAPNSGSGTIYDVVRGEPGSLPVGGAGEVCLESDSGDTSAQDPSAPRSGAGFYYLVRGENACGVGTYGQDSAANTRTTNACP